MHLAIIMVCFHWRDRSRGLKARQVIYRYSTSTKQNKIFKKACQVLKVQVMNQTREIYLLLTEFEGRTVSYGTSFFLLDFSRLGDKSKGKQQGSVTCSTDRENEVSKIFIISLVCEWRAQERFLFTRKGFKFLTHLESKTSQFEILFKHNLE